MAEELGQSPREARMSVYFVFLRRPRGPSDRRSDPFWEFGSFGRTGCHSKNLLNPRTSRVRDGDRLAFLQGGRGEIRVVAVTPPVRVHRDDQHIEIRWDKRHRPLQFSDAPLLIDNHGRTDIPAIRGQLKSVRRSTPCGQAGSRFRTMSAAIPTPIAKQAIAQHAARRSRAINGYCDAIEAPGSAWHTQAVRKGWHLRARRLADFRRMGGKRPIRTSKCLPLSRTKRERPVDKNRC